MNVIERDIIDKFQQLEPDARQRVLQSLTDAAVSSFDYAAWWSEVESLQAAIHARLGDNATIGALSLLSELREESA
jgi:hypothetical protein